MSDRCIGNRGSSPHQSRLHPSILTISESEVEVILLVPQELVSGGVHGEDTERGVGATLRGD